MGFSFFYWIFSFLNEGLPAAELRGIRPNEIKIRFMERLVANSLACTRVIGYTLEMGR